MVYVILCSHIWRCCCSSLCPLGQLFMHGHQDNSALHQQIQTIIREVHLLDLFLRTPYEVCLIWWYVRENVTIITVTFSFKNRTKGTRKLPHYCEVCGKNQVASPPLVGLNFPHLLFPCLFDLKSLEAKKGLLLRKGNESELLTFVALAAEGNMVTLFNIVSHLRHSIKKGTVPQ